MQGKKRKSDFAGRFFLFLCESVIRVKVKRSDPFGSLPFSMYPPMHGDWGPRWALTQRVQWGDKA